MDTIKISTNALAFADFLEGSPIFKVVNNVVDNTKAIYQREIDIPREEKADYSGILLSIICISHLPQLIRSLVAKNDLLSLAKYEKDSCYATEMAYIQGEVDCLRKHPFFSESWYGSLI